MDYSKDFYKILYFQDSGLTPLMQACRKDDYEGVQSLLNKGVNLEVYDAVSSKLFKSF